MTAPRRRPSRRSDASMRAIGYCRVSTGSQVESGAGLDAQHAAIAERAGREGWTVEMVVDAGLSGRSVASRPALVDALDRLDRGEADVLVASKLDRVSRSVADFARLLDRARANGWRLVLLDLGVDTSTDAGEFVANTVANSAQYERRLISARTREGLAAKRAAGVRLGRPSALPDVVVRRILAERTDGRMLREIADGLTADGVPTARGAAIWRTSTVQGVLAGQDAARLTAEASTA